LVTGGVTGIGLGIAKAFAAAGMKLVLTYRANAEHLDEALRYFATQPGVQVQAIQLDVTDRRSVERAAEEAQRAFGKIHVLCNNAGVNLLGPADEATHDDWDWILGVNLGGVINTLVSVIPCIKAHGEGGHIVNVASMSSFISGPMSTIYATSKFAVRGLSEGLRYTLASHNIGVSLACPGLTRTTIYRSPLSRDADLQRTGAPLDAGKLQQLERVHAHGMHPDEVGRKILCGMQRGDFYIFSHAEFRQEVMDLHGEICAAFPQDEVDEGRLAIEEVRRQKIAEARAAIERLRGLR
jgi:NAD(P)-dependent dehydrogenase (short-subunit alcohol dehydrogenase family)